MAESDIRGTLREMGFNDNEVTSALSMVGNDLDMAISVLVGGADGSSPSNIPTLEDAPIFPNYDASAFDAFDHNPFPTGPPPPSPKQSHVDSLGTLAATATTTALQPMTGITSTSNHINSNLGGTTTSSALPTTGSVVSTGFPLTSAQEAQELEKAIEISRQASSVSVATTIDENTDAAMQEVLLKSLSSVNQSSIGHAGMGSSLLGWSVSYEPENPHERLRLENIPPGLRNVGNTCFVNSIVQTYFSIPEFRAAILAFRPEPTSWSSLSPPVPPRSSGSTATTATAVDTATEATKKEEEERRHRLDNSVFFIHQLQKLFATLIMTEKRYADPTDVIKSLRDDGGNPISIGSQEDTSEFNNTMISRMEDAFQRMDRQATRATKTSITRTTFVLTDSDLEDSERPSSQSKAQSSDKSRKDNVIRQLFFGKELSVIETNNKDGITQSTASSEDFNQLILDIQGQQNLYSSLDHYTSATDVELKNEEGEDAQANKTVWFRSLPPVLTFQLNRVVFDEASKSGKKLNDAFAFDSLIYMDRYLEKNAEITMRRREMISALKEELATEEAKLTYFTNYNQTNSSLPTLLQGSIDALSSSKIHDLLGPSSYSASDGQIAERLLVSTKSVVEKEIAELENRVSELKTRITEMFADQQRHPYRLHSVLVHDGVAGSGHYWVYIHDFESSSWIKASDMQVSRVGEEEVWSNGVGGHGTTASAYCLIYLNASRDGTISVPKSPSVSPANNNKNNNHNQSSASTSSKVLFPTSSSEISQLIPKGLCEIVKAENEALHRAMKTWDQKKLLDSFQSVLKEFQGKFNPRVERLFNAISSSFQKNEDREPKLISFYHYLLVNDDTREIGLILLADETTESYSQVPLRFQANVDLKQAIINKALETQKNLSMVQRVPSTFVFDSPESFTKIRMQLQSRYTKYLSDIPVLLRVLDFATSTLPTLEADLDYPAPQSIAVNKSLAEFYEREAKKDAEIQAAIGMIAKFLFARFDTVETHDMGIEVATRVLRVMIISLQFRAGFYHGSSMIEKSLDIGLFVARVVTSLFSALHRHSLPTSQPLRFYYTTQEKWCEWVSKEIAPGLRAEVLKTKADAIYKLWSNQMAVTVPDIVFPSATDPTLRTREPSTLIDETSNLGSMFEELATRFYKMYHNHNSYRICFTVRPTNFLT